MPDRISVIVGDKRYEDLKDLSRILDKTVTDLMKDLIDQAVLKNKENIAYLRRIRKAIPNPRAAEDEIHR